MKRILKAALFVSALAVAACAKEGSESAPAIYGSGLDLSTKVVRLGSEVSDSTFLVKLSEVPSAEALSALEESSGVSLVKVFPSTPGKEALEAEFGLDRWYEATLVEGGRLDASVRKMAARNDVLLVEYEAIARKGSDGVMYPASGQAPQTRATAAFNDPYLADQWHYKNYGNPAISKASVAGADINVLDVWATLTCGDPDIIVAVVDEGVKHTHPDLRDNMWVNKGEIPNNGVDDDNNGYVDDVYGFNFVTNGPISWDEGYYDERKVWRGDSGH